MIRHQELVFALAGQSFFFDCPEGRPDPNPAPTVKVYLATNADNAPVEAATTGAVAIEAIDTTLALPAAAQSNQLTLNSAAGIAKGRRLLLTGADTGSELAEVVGVAGAVVTLRRPLLNSYNTGDKFQSTRLSINVDATWINLENRISDILGVNWRTDREPRQDWLAGYAGYRVRWSYSVGGVPALSTSFADVVRYPAKNYTNPLDVDNRFPGWIDRLPTDYIHDQGASLLLEAFYAFKLDAMADNQALRRIRNTEIVAELTVHRANVMIAEGQVLAGSADPKILDVAQKIYRQRYDQLVREPKFQVDQTSAGESSQARRLPLMRR